MTGHTSNAGCGRCCVKGFKHSITNAVVFPDTNAQRMSDEGFRKYRYKQQKNLSPLVELPIDMIHDFAVGDSLHLIDLGIVKTFLKGYMEGKLTNIDAKWSSNQIIEINEYLKEVKAPIEIKSQRAIRTLSDFSKWKGREFRTFFLYPSIVVYRSFLKPHLFNHFLLLYCGLRIFYNDAHLKQYLTIGGTCIEHYLAGFKSLYGNQHMTSNFHNLAHLVDDVKRFGNLDTFNAYPFESELYSLKKFIMNGSGKSPLCQVAKRLNERADYNSSVHVPSKSKIELKKFINDKEIKSDIRRRLEIFCNSSKYYTYGKVELELFSIDTANFADSWILLDSGHIMKVTLIVSMPKNEVFLYGNILRNSSNFFEIPFPSSYLSIFSTDNIDIFGNDIIVNPNRIKCKFFCLKESLSYEELNKKNEKGEGEEEEEEEANSNDMKYVFIPIVHTLN